MLTRTVLLNFAMLVLALAISASAFTSHLFTLPVHADSVHSPHVQEQSESAFSCEDVQGILEAGPSSAITFQLTPSSNSQTLRISLSNIGQEGNGPSSNPSISGDERTIAFDSNASNLMPGNPNGHFHVYVYDLQTEQLVRVSESGRHSRWPAISRDGRSILFTSWNVPGTGDLSIQLYVHDRDTGTTQPVSISSQGVPGNGSYMSKSISANGRFIAFSSDSDNLVPDDNNYSEDVFVHDRETGKTERVSVSSTGEEADYGDSSGASISADGRYVAFHSRASNFVADDNNNKYDIFIHDRETKTVEHISFRFEGYEGDADIYYPRLTPDARYVVFTNGGYVLVHDRQQKTTEIITPSPDASTQGGTISDDGRIVAFVSTFNPQSPSTPFPYANIYIHDRTTGKYWPQSLTYDGNFHNKELETVILSGDGQFIAISTDASNLVLDDTNNFSDVFIHYPCLDGKCEKKPEFTDVSPSHYATPFINRLANARITGGCKLDPPMYCPADLVKRGDMAIFLERGMHYPEDFTPPPATGIFEDVPTYYATSWIEQLYHDGVTGGCSLLPLKFCPNSNVTRGQMAIFLLRAKNGKEYQPPAYEGLFEDVPSTHFAARWIEQLYRDGITAGCSVTPMKYCPQQSVTRADMAVFLVRNFDLP
jgi:Tol biopolymer transport system component